MDTIRVVDINFGKFLTTKFREWEDSKGSRQSVSSFARYLGVKQPTLTRWMQGDNVPDAVNLAVISRKLGLEVYDALGVPRPDPKHIPLSQLPQDLRLRLFDALDEIDSALTSKNLDPDSPEGEELARQVLSDFGFDVREITRE